jgi:hypothetical protein
MAREKEMQSEGPYGLYNGTVALRFFMNNGPVHEVQGPVIT